MLPNLFLPLKNSLPIFRLLASIVSFFYSLELSFASAASFTSMFKILLNASPLPRPEVFKRDCDLGEKSWQIYSEFDVFPNS